MKTIFIDKGFDKYLSEKIEKGNIHSNIQEHLPIQKVEAKTLHRALEKGKSLLTGFDMPRQEEEQLRKALGVISKVAEDAERKKKEAIITEKNLVQALDILTEFAKEQKG